MEPQMGFAQCFPVPTVIPPCNNPSLSISSSPQSEIRDFPANSLFLSFVSASAPLVACGFTTHGPSNCAVFPVLLYSLLREPGKVSFPNRTLTFPVARTLDGLSQGEIQPATTGVIGIDSPPTARVYSGPKKGRIPLVRLVIGRIRQSTLHNRAGRLA